MPEEERHERRFAAGGVGKISYVYMIMSIPFCRRLITRSNENMIFYRSTSVICISTPDLS